jgi:hypothetical protein
MEPKAINATDSDPGRSGTGWTIAAWIFGLLSLIPIAWIFSTWLILPGVSMPFRLGFTVLCLTLIAACIYAAKWCFVKRDRHLELD